MSTKGDMAFDAWLEQIYDATPVLGKCPDCGGEVKAMHDGTRCLDCGAELTEEQVIKG